MTNNAAMAHLDQKAIGRILNDPELFAWTFLKIRDVDKALIPLKYKPAQLDYLSKRTRRDLILKPRHIGFSTTVQAEFFRLGLIRPIRSTTLAHDDTTTQTLRLMVERFYENFPTIDGMRPERTLANARITTYSDSDSEAATGTAGSRNTGRGSSNTHVHLSEAAFYKDLDSILAGLLQAGNPIAVLESSPNGATGKFFELCMEALDGNSIWMLHFYTWWWEPGYRRPLEPDETLVYTPEEQALVDAHGLTPEQINWRRYKIAEIGERLFKQEYAEDPRSCFLMSGESYFGDVSAAFTAPLSIKPVENRRYAGGLDFAQTNDFTVLIIVDTTTLQMVDILRINQQSWADMRAEIERVAKYWNNARVLAEWNSIGGVNLELLQSAGLDVIPFYTTDISKPPLIQSLKYGLTEGGLTLQNDIVDPVLKNELQTFISQQTPKGAWQYQAQANAHDDTVIALALAYYLARQMQAMDSSGWSM